MLLLASSFSLLSVEAKETIKTKIVVDAGSSTNVDRGTSCYLVFPEGQPLETLKSAGVDRIVQAALDKKGYLIVANPDEANLFVKVDYAAGEPFPAEVTFQQQDSFDYSNAASTRNYAATMLGGRYHMLANPQRNRDIGSTGFVLGPNGEVIDVGTQKEIGAEVVEGEKEERTVTVYPFVFEISAWKFDEAQPHADPTRVWHATAVYQNVQDEPAEEVLDEMAIAAAKQVGKSLKKPKLTNRKSG